MAASPNDPRTKRRLAAGDDVNKVSMAPQPIPGMPQDGKGGNMMNNPMIDIEGQMSQRIGGPASMPYGDMSLSPDDGRLGNVGFTERSNQPQYMVPGRGQNSDLLGVKEPGAEQMSMMEPMYDMSSAMGKTMPNGLNNGQPVSYNITALGPSGQSVDAVMKGAMGVPGAIPAQMQTQSNNTLPPQGIPMESGGMSMGRGGGRNKKS